MRQATTWWEASRGTRRCKLTMYAMHLVELSERPSAISMVQRARRNGLPFSSRRGRKGGEVVQVAFEAFQPLSAVTVKPMTAISDLSTIHEDIIASTLHKRAALIVLPFHKMLCHDGTLESVDGAYHHVNIRVLRKAPCMVAVLVDRALGGMAQVSAPDVSYAVLLLFFGGSDDREALAYASRMAEHPGIALTVARFTTSTKLATADELAAIDEEAIQRYVSTAPKPKDGDGSIRYEEVTAEDRPEVASAIKALGKGKNLVVTGRSARATPLVEESDCPELGPVGSYLAMAEFSTTRRPCWWCGGTTGGTTYPTWKRAGDHEEEEVVEDAVLPVPMPSPAYTPTRPAPEENPHGGT